MNAGCMTLDRDQRPHVITYQLPTPRRPEQLQHSPPAEIARDLRLVHYWRDGDGRWQGGQPIQAGTQFGGVARGDAVFDRENNLYFFYQPRSGEPGFVCLEAGAAERWSRWRGYRLTGSELAGRDASKHDRRRWQADGVLSFTGLHGARGFAIADFVLRRSAPAGN
jgi:hypothetical protein